MSDKELHFGASPKLFQYARINRRPLTPSERKLWNCIRSGRLKGFKFRRQHPVADYIVDFFCLQCKLALEIDGGYHRDLEQIKYDNDRNRVLAEFGIRTIRFTNTEIDEDLPMVVREIERSVVDM
ncbi:MAG TPA: endonuclease domain-containing protein [Chryseolinea sp.]|nr:endonuclease domain-containing protein [Chryseolinea sp.]